MKPIRSPWWSVLCMLGLGLVALQAGCKDSDKSKTTPASTKTEAAGKTDQTPAAPKDATADAGLPKVPLGLDPLEIPADNPMTLAKVELGKKLYFDPRLSKDGTVSCATCHDPKKGWTDNLPTSKGIDAQSGDRNAPTVINAAYNKTQFWDGRSPSLEDQALGPIANAVEMGHTVDAMVADLSKIEGYTKEFQAVFGTGITKEGVAQAIAAFERTVLSGNSAYDRSHAGDENALTEAQKRGLELFETVGCDGCHTPPLFTNQGFYNAGVGMEKEKVDEGRKTVTGKDTDLGKFRVPMLREIVHTAPYFHDGSAATLEDAVALMAAGGTGYKGVPPALAGIAGKLTADDQKDIVEFLKALSGEPYPDVAPPELPK